MALALLLIFVVAPLVELAVIVSVVGTIGVADTIGLLIVVSLIGVWLARREGLGVLRRIQAAVDRGQAPSTEVIDGGLILVAGALMILPGFVGDVIALLLLVPPTRALIRIPVLAWITTRGRTMAARRLRFYAAGTRTRGDGQVDVWDVESWEDPPEPPRRGELRDPT
jgi:UPF0716 protein FxsA